MSTSDPNDPTPIERQIHAIELKHQVDELTGGKMHAWESDESPPEIAEQFWQNVLDYESAPETTHWAQLQTAGLDLPPPEAMSDTELTAKLGEMIEALAHLRVFVNGTNHLSDRELYTHLWQESLRETTIAMPVNPFWNCHLDLVGTGSDEDNHLYLKYYADEDARRHWKEQFPDYEMPDHEDPPYDRDAHLPQPVYPEWRDMEPDERAGEEDGDQPAE